MGARGPKPGKGVGYKSTERRAKSSTVKAGASKPRKPAWLKSRGGLASKHFDSVSRLLCENGVMLQSIDADAIAGYCVLWEAFVGAEDLATRLKVHPALDRAAKSLGLTPSSRARIDVKSDDASSDLDQFLKPIGDSA